MASPRLIALLPVLNDWTAAGLLIPRICAAAGGFGPVGILIVDDGSWVPLDGRLLSSPDPAWIRVLTLRRNLGHQRAIAVGLSYIDEHLPCEAVLVMDADGEDRPEEIPALLARYREDGGRSIVFAERKRRVEGVRFRTFYAIYRLVHWLLTGRGVKVGNFSLVPERQLRSLVVVSELWIHYAASVVRSKQAWCMVPTIRGPRLEGRSQMNFAALVVHGLSAIAVYSDLVFTRLVMAASALAALSLGGAAVLVGLHVTGARPAPAWAPMAVGILSVVVLQFLTFIVSLTFLVLGSRQQASVIPRRDYGLYVAEVLDVVRGAATQAATE